MKRFLFIITFIIVLALVLRINFVKNDLHPWAVKSIDTMKYSRDTSREVLHNPSFDKIIDQQVSAIAQTGATHVAIATPYDDEFNPVLKRWVKAARKHDLKVWFRGNWSGWERWFDYPKIGREEHIARTKQFIANNSGLFEDGDIFTSCPECENGSEVNFGDQREVDAYRKFLIDEYTAVKESFKVIKKDVKGNYYSMNGDVARTVMDKKTTSALDGVVTIDHYVGTPEQLVKDVQFYAEHSGGKVVLGEFGAPIPDIHGDMSEEEQRKWLENALRQLAELEELEGINYWVNVGGSTALWTDDHMPRAGVAVLTKAFKGKL